MVDHDRDDDREESAPPPRGSGEDGEPETLLPWKRTSEEARSEGSGADSETSAPGAASGEPPEEASADSGGAGPATSAGSPPDEAFAASREDGGDGEPPDRARWALVAAVAALVVATAAFVRPWVVGVEDRVEARSVAVVDADGRTRAVLGTGDGGRVSLRLLDRSGRPAATLEAGDASPELNLQGREGQARLGLGDVVQNGGGLSFYDASDRLRVGLAFSPGVGSNVVLGNDDGNVGVQIALDPQGPFVTLRAPDGSVMWAIPEPPPGSEDAGGSE